MLVAVDHSRSAQHLDKPASILAVDGVSASSSSSPSQAVAVWLIAASPAGYH